MSTWNVRKFGSVTAGLLLLALSSRDVSGDDARAASPSPTDRVNALGNPYASCKDGACAAEGRGAYVGVFGGAGGTNVDTFTKRGTVLIPDSSGGPLALRADGSSKNQAMGLVGMTLGYEWSGRSIGREGNWSLLPAAEVEAFYMGGTLRAFLNHPTERVLPSNTFDVTLPIDSGVYLTNVVLTLRNPHAVISPYVGFGIGAAYLSNKGAFDEQLTPPEPGLNHFNTDPNASTWAFVGQVKAGVRIPLGERCHLFAEYRYLHFSSSTRTFGQTARTSAAPAHSPTAPWTVELRDMGSHLGVCGIGFRF